MAEKIPKSTEAKSFLSHLFKQYFMQCQHCI